MELPVTLNVPLKTTFTRLVRPVTLNVPLNTAFTSLVRQETPNVPVIIAFLLRERALDVTAKVPVLVPPAVPPEHFRVTFGWTVKGEPDALLVRYI